MSRVNVIKVNLFGTSKHFLMCSEPFTINEGSTSFYNGQCSSVVIVRSELTINIYKSTILLLCRCFEMAQPFIYFILILFNIIYRLFI